MNDEWEPSDGASQPSMIDRIFGFNTTPSAWSSCFANLDQLENVSTVAHYDGTTLHIRRAQVRIY
jgi:hypothetical protein